MSPKIKYSKDLIRKEAYKIAIKHGISEISARNLANVMGCSVAPIYSNYSNIDELLNEIKEEVQTLMWSYSSKKYTNIAFFNMGIGQILFAKEYPELMKEIMIQKIQEHKRFEYAVEFLIDIMETDPSLQGINRNQLNQILDAMSYLTLGICLQIVNDQKSSKDIKAYIEMLQITGGQLIFSASQVKDDMFLKNLDWLIDLDDIL